MRMLRTDTDIVSSGTIETKQTGIGGDAKIVFAILSGMVTDAIEYSIREPGTNAWEANLKKPFEVTLPTRFNNVIRWRDFGKGLSHSFMMSRYAKIGESTKDQDDDAVGGWGFGSKSPLAYLMHQDGGVGAFNVISRHQGMRRAYVIGINAKGKIQISCLAEEVMDATDRGTGLEVSFPVQEKDIERFVQYVDRIYWGFNPRPLIFPADPERPALGRGKVKAKGSNWRLYEQAEKQTRYSTRSTAAPPPWSGPHIRVGCVLYPVQLHLLDGLTGFLTKDDNLLMEAPIGSVDVSTSREQLSYTDRTKQALSALFQDYELGLVANIQQDVDLQPNYFKACHAAKRGCDVLGWERTQGLFERMTWKGIPLKSEMFRDTQPGSPIRVCTVGGVQGFPNAFKASWINPYLLDNVRVAVEHQPYRSFERFAGAGLLDDKTTRMLWVRCKRDQLDHLKLVLGLSDADLVILDDVKLPKRDKNAKEADTTRTKMRVRRQLDWNGNKETSTIDMLGGGLYVDEDEGKGRGRYEHRYYYPAGEDGDTSVFKSVRKDRMDSGYFDPIRKLKLLTEEDLDLPILIRKPNEVLEGDWTPLAEFLKDKLETALDTSKLTPRLSWDKDSFESEFYKLTHAVENVDLPAPLQAPALNMLTLLDSRPVDQSKDFNEHDKILDALKLICHGVIVPQSDDPSGDINGVWLDYAAKHPMLRFALSEMSMYGPYDFKTGKYPTQATDADKTNIASYLAMAKLAGM